ncbi:MAG: type secretory pathway, ATPase PulE/Tfp pilus assembly pathway, ATPase PilB [Betaproteobacteria bacterium]|nr:type secretory pathway, ATPase PulE/Tfp pilus assembly pathway, ATPase PilB [Betaproteobacteria bacterium]
MSAVLNPKPAAQAPDVNLKLNFQKNLQTVTNKVHATNNVDEIMLEVSQDICNLFNADRLTIYSVGEDKASIISKVKTGLNSFKDLKLPIAEQSIAGYVALSRKLINIKDVYDEAELKSFNPNLRFLQEVDKRTGYRTKQMLVAPIIDQQASELIGVVQIINNKSGQNFGQLEEEGASALTQTLAIAFRQRQKSAAPVKTKYDYLVADAVLSAQEFDLATRSARRKGLDIEDVLISEFQVKIPALGAALAKFFSVPYEPFKADRIKPADLLKNLKRDYVESSQWVPVDDAKEGLVVVCLDPERIKGSRIVNNIFPRASKIAYRVTTQQEFKQTLTSLFGEQTDTSSIDDLLSGMDEEDDSALGGSSDDVDAAADNELVKLVNKIIVDAYNQGASDIHIEPYPGKAKTEIRFRKDGSLYPYIEIPASYRAAIVARLKIMCDLDISEKRKPQDGKIKFKKFGPLDIELRVATIPTAGGVEDVVMRILAAGEPIPIDKLGLTKYNLETLKKTVSKPYGLFFVCGPTGSGKTTTLHSVLGFLNTVDTKIWTAEDPVEITQKGLRQVQVNKKAGLDFAVVMRAFLRADPDIIMVGEMRDAETTGTGIEASLTGHLVFATLHTNSAPEAVIRLLDMGMDPFNFSDALLGILAQRLGKRLCGECKEAYTPDANELKAFISEYAEELVKTPAWKTDPQGSFKKLYDRWLAEYGKEGKLVMFKAKGCDKCGNSGYKGRVGLHELMVASDRVKKLIQEKGRVSDIFVTAVEEGMSTLKMDGMEKILMGLTDLKQVRTVCIK